jgi:uncharacterized protein (DUF1697 family)
MNNLLKITTKPIKISVQIEKGKFIKVERSIQLRNQYNKTNDQLVRSNNLTQHRVEELPKKIKLNQSENNVHTIINQNFMQDESRNIPFISQYNNEITIEPIPKDIEHDIKYQPSNLDFVINQYSEIEFEYVGEPIYIPLSANPNKD